MTKRHDDPQKKDLKGVLGHKAGCHWVDSTSINFETFKSGGWAWTILSTISL